MGRFPRALLAFAAALGLSGCLLFTDPINQAPVVTVTQLTDEVTCCTPAKFKATVTDDEDRPQSWPLNWAVFNSPLPRCDWITAADWASPTVSATPLDSSTPYTFTPQTPVVVCVCAQATDHHSAVGQGCLPPITPKPVIVDVSGETSGQPRPLCAQVHLSAACSTLSADDNIQFNWSLQYSGTDPRGKSVQLAACTGGATDNSEQCFYAAGPGTYTVTLSTTDSVVPNGSITTATSDSFVIPVNGDTPPCIQRTDPDVYAQRILLSRSTDVGGSYQSRIFRVLNVADDCEPYPLPAGSTSMPTQFHWSVYDSTQTPPTWTYPTNTSDSFTVSQALFPKARPGDTIKLRVEARDTLVQDSYKSPAYQVCSSDTDICCGTSACGGTPNDCIRWTTWTVQFQP